ncbi:putative transposase [Sulfurisphaera tokodaii str. 7]|uniref:Transposase n=1 Tax=Sulfurisphaera tokodaii (strain DSM 16993 / JCM 10545 / NBRC 100140 / 7) TaxID=273063 RepID=F9VNP9_SULTO|nr:putative transposase [Sulfurisphaera tokodaii str. 7]
MIKSIFLDVLPITVKNIAKDFEMVMQFWRSWTSLILGLFMVIGSLR